MTKILIIEGIGPLREAIAEVLREANFTTITADHGVAGLEQARIHVPDLILCDTDVLYLNGYAVFRDLRRSRETAGIPFILMTPPTEQAVCSQDGMLDVIRLYKPFSVPSLMGVVQGQLNKSQNRFRNVFAVS